MQPILFAWMKLLLFKNFGTMRWCIWPRPIFCPQRRAIRVFDEREEGFSLPEQMTHFHSSDMPVMSTTHTEDAFCENIRWMRQSVLLHGSHRTTCMRLCPVLPAKLYRKRILWLRSVCKLPVLKTATFHVYPVYFRRYFRTHCSLLFWFRLCHFLVDL